LGAPQSQTDYLNACSTAACQAFDNCQRLGLCGADNPVPTPVDPSNPAIPPLVNPVTVPTKSCTDGATNLIYMFGTSDFAPMLRAVQPLLSANTPSYRAVYQNASSCAGVASVFDSTKRIIKDPAPSATPNYAFYFDENSRQVNCLLDTGGDTIDIGVSNLFSTTCNTDTASYVSGSGVSDYTGPVVPFVVSVPSTSSEQSVSTEALHIVFGLGGRSGGSNGVKDAVPWTDPTFYCIRNSGSGSTVLSALLIKVPKTKFWGIDRLSTDNLRDSLLASPVVNETIGILSIDYADKNRGNLRSLYLQSTGQLCGYLPDSNLNSYDKKNVRDGHYPLWGYVHFFTPIGTGGVPADAAKTFVTRFSVSRLDQGLVDNIIGASLVPQCAMKVARSTDIGDYTPQVGFQCGCYFDFRTTGKTDCKPCTSPSDCTADRGACNYGYCEQE
jgi:ABC-type phosphate transport system substrate-binding protein